MELNGNQSVAQFNPEQLGTKSTSWWERRVCAKETQSKNLQDFQNAVNYLRSKYNIAGTDLDSRLTEQLDHYKSNGRGINNTGGRLRAFTQDDFNSLKSEFEKIIQNRADNINKIKTNLENLLDLTNVNEAQCDYICDYGANMIFDGYKCDFVKTICNSMAIFYREGLDEKLPSEINVRDTTRPNSTAFRNLKHRRQSVVDNLIRIMEQNGADYELVKKYEEGQQTSSWSLASMAWKYILLSQQEKNIEDRYYLGSTSKLCGKFASSKSKWVR